MDDSNNFVVTFTKDPKQDFGVFAKGYAQAAAVLANYILEKPHFLDYEAYPVVFLYRHAFELYLKGFYYKASLIFLLRDFPNEEYKFIYRHWLKTLAETFQKICRTLYPIDEQLSRLADKVVVYAKEFEQIDKDSYGYRYPISTNGKPSTKANQTVNLLSLHNSMRELLSELEVIDFRFDTEKSEASEIYEIMQNAEALLASEIESDDYEEDGYR